jgi:hypothetical protein
MGYFANEEYSLETFPKVILCAVSNGKVLIKLPSAEIQRREDDLLPSIFFPEKGGN